MLSSGVVKLTSQDPNWANLVALAYHYESQPIPNPISLFAHALPLWVHKGSAIVMFIVELGFPFFLFFGPTFRLIGAIGFIGLQLLILLTGNYGFFNLLTLSLCFLWLPDSFIPKRLQCPLTPQNNLSWRGQLLVHCTLAVLVWNQLVLTIGLFFPAVRPWMLADELNHRLHLSNPYGLFAVMTVDRYEIEVQGSHDGKQWETYIFPYKADPIDRRPPILFPGHMPRLDWQMWFASLSRFHKTFWFQIFLRKLLEGSPSVTGLLAKNPFQNKPPLQVRARFWQYRFQTPGEYRKTGQWWIREFVGEYAPPISLR